MNSLTKLILVIVLGCVVITGLVLYLIKPSLGQVSKLNQNLRDKKTENKTLEQQILAFRTAQSDLAKASEKERIAAAIVDKETLAESIKVVENASDSTGSSHILSIEEELQAAAGATRGRGGAQAKAPANVISGKRGVGEVPYVLSVKNDFIGLLNFIKYLEHSPHFTEISSFELRSELTSADSGAVSSTGQINGTLNGVFFINKKAAEEPAQESTNETTTDTEN
ncbi:MAG TPA: hypothetical protein VD998_02890 [Verrucomicrobiae bacterium]|nr:hypothetical protein [Verrucomicrobiae bacterium]